MEDKPYPLLKADEIASMDETINTHQFNAKARRHTRSLGDILGFSQLGLHLVRLEPGDESTQFHFHHNDEEFLYILSGNGVAEIDNQKHEIGPGDFMGFVQHSLPHCLTNPYKEDLVYLMGGTRNEFDICDYPRINRRMFRVNGEKTFVDMVDLHDVEPTSR